MQSQDMDEEEQSEISQWYGVREGTLFVVDTTQKMFEIDPETKLSYIHTFFKMYKQILRQKLAWNMKDWMGVILFGTEQNNHRCWEHIQTLQELKIVTLDDLQFIRKLTKSSVKGYQSMQSDKTYPLLNVLSYAMDIFFKIKTVLVKRRIVLITCHNPDLEENEKNLIRSKADSLKNLDIKLYVINLHKNGALDPFYKDLEMLSRKTDAAVYKMTSLMDLVQQIKAPTKNIAQLPFKVCDDLELDLVVRTLGRKYRSLQIRQLSKATGEILSTSRYFKKLEGDFYNEENSDDEETEEINMPYMIPEEVHWETKELFGGEKLRFKKDEIFKVKHIHQPGIKLIGVRSIPNDLFRYHVKRQYFVRANHSSTRKDNLLFFSALLNKCNAARKMIICAFTMRMNTQTNLCYMIPNIELGGFYLLKVAYLGTIGDKNEVLQHYETQQKVTDKEVDLWKRTIDQLNITYHPYMFRSYKLECQMQIVEKLALDKKPGPSPDDTMEKSYLSTCKKAAELIPELNNMYSSIDKPPKAKRARKTKAT